MTCPGSIWTKSRPSHIKGPGGIGSCSAVGHLRVVVLGREASQTRDCRVAENATRRAARPGPSLRKERLLRMTTKLHHYPPENDFGLAT